jgi:FAD/FMN-containing dehydrogenase
MMQAEKMDVLSRLISILWSEGVSDSPADILPYMSDSYSLVMQKDVKPPDFVVLPGNSQEVQAIVRLANDIRMPVYPRSFGVNIAASAVPYSGGLVMDLKRMNRIHEIDEETMTATIEPGVSWGKLRKEANKKGLDTMPILGPYQGSAVGNFLLTNITAYSTKHMADRAVTFEAVLPNGEILRTGSQAVEKGAELNPYFRYSYGPDVTGLFRGSLGNFGIITKLVIMLRPRFEIEGIRLFGFRDFRQAITALGNIERMDISRYGMFFNDYFWMHTLLTPQELKDPGERQRMLSLLPEYMLVVGLGGKPKQVSLYEEMVQEQVSKDGGVRVDLDERIHSDAYELAEGASRKVLRMFAPFSGYMPIITCVPVRQAIKIKELGEELVKKYGLIDPLSGRSLKPEVLVIPYDRCSTVYLEQEILFDPADAESTQKAFRCVREGYAKSTSLYGGVHTMPNRSLLKILNPAYTQILRTVKHAVDPNGIFMGGPYSFS